MACIMADSPGPCVKASTHSSIHPFFFHLSSHLLSHPSIGPHPPTFPLPPVCLQYPFHHYLLHSLSPFLVIFLWLVLKSLLNSASLNFSLCSTSSVSFTKAPDWANWVSAPGASDHWDNGCGSPDGEAPGGYRVCQSK